MTKRIIVMLCVIFALASCTSPAQRALKDLEKFTTKIEEKSETFTQEQWDEIGDEYERISDAIDAHHSEYTDQELEKIGQLNARCLVAMGKHALKSIKGGLGGILENLGGMLE